MQNFTTALSHPTLRPRLLKLTPNWISAGEEYKRPAGARNSRFAQIPHRKF